MSERKFSIKNILFSKLNHKIIILFSVLNILITISIILLIYLISREFFIETFLLNNYNNIIILSIVIIIFLSIGIVILKLYLRKTIINPLKKVYNATKEIKNGNYEKVSLNIKNEDEIGKLAKLINQTTESLSRLDEKKKILDEAKTRFLTITSHELRSPMTPMKAQLQMLEQGYFGNLKAEQKDSLNMIIRNAERLDKIISDFLEISRIEAARLKFEFKKTNLKETIDEIVKFMEGFALEKNITLKKEIKDLPEIMVDPDRVNQVLSNIINNAIKFSDDGNEIIINAEQKDNFIHFQVKDFGTGISPEDQIRIFEPFYQIEKTSNKKYCGTGLGLAICRGIVECQKGKIWVESKKGKGSTFHFTVPLEPVRKIDPIKILFSHKSIIDKKIQDEFQTMLGPLGLWEFNDLKNKNALDKDNIFDVINILQERSILDSNQAEIFKDKINGIFKNNSF